LGFSRFLNGWVRSPPYAQTVGEIQAELEDYLAYYNGRRPHMALEGLAPLEFLAKLQAESVPQESQMC
jgi:putative transposase